MSPAAPPASTPNFSLNIHLQVQKQLCTEQKVDGCLGIKSSECLQTVFGERNNEAQKIQNHIDCCHKHFTLTWQILMLWNSKKLFFILESFFSSCNEALLDLLTFRSFDFKDPPFSVLVLAVETAADAVGSASWREVIGREVRTDTPCLKVFVNASSLTRSTSGSSTLSNDDDDLHCSFMLAVVPVFRCCCCCCSLATCKRTTLHSHSNQQEADFSNRNRYN